MCIGKNVICVICVSLYYVKYKCYLYNVSISINDKCM